MTWASLTLTGQDSWSPEHLLSSGQDADWPAGDWPKIALQDLVEAVITPDGLADEGQPVVTPRGLSLSTGHVMQTTSRYSGRVYVPSANRDSLGVGDLLIPRSPSLPALVVSENHLGLCFAGSFHCFRMSNQAIAAWLWGILSSKTGQRVRHGASPEMGGSIISRGRLLNLAVPIPVPSELERLVDLMRAALERSGRVDRVWDDVQGSWWRTAVLPVEGRWDVFINFADPDSFSSGATLASLCEDIHTGRPVNDVAIPVAIPGWLPVYTSRSVRVGRRSDLSVRPAARITIAEAGDVLIPAVGLAGLSAVADQRSAVGSGILRCRLHDPGVAEVLVRYLNSERGQAVRRTVVSGVIPRLTRRSAQTFPVPSDLTGDASASGVEQSRSLGEKLDDLLWN